jgi:CPA2 family monovalent cation:H+ antiporter-2
MYFTFLINRIKVQFRLGNYIIAKKEDVLSEAEDND